MITPGQVEEWLSEVEARPVSAALIIRQIALRLSELADRNEALLAENIALRSGKRVEEYENRLANLEYQLEMLKRQVGGALPLPLADTLSLLLYDAAGHVLRLELDKDELISAGQIARFVGEPLEAGGPLSLLVVSSQEELLFAFDTGRVVSLPAAEIPPVDRQKLAWEQAYLQEPQGLETLAFVLPIARMALYEYALQASRRGYVKKIKETFLETCITNANIGSGVVLRPDKTCGLAFCAQDDRLALVTQEGYLLCMPVNLLPYTIEEVLRLNVSDHLVSAFAIGQKSSFIAITQHGKAFHREMSWLEPSASFKTQGQSILSKARRQAGVRLVAAAAVDENDWGVVLASDGSLTTHKLGDIFGKGAVLDSSSGLEVLGFAAFSLA